MSSLPRHRDLVDIWRYIRKESSQETADRVESIIRRKFLYPADFPNAAPFTPGLLGRRRRAHFHFDMFERLLPCQCQVVQLLKIQPELRRVAKVAP